MEDVPKSIGLPLADEETDIEVSNEDADKESDLLDVEKLVMSEDWGDKDEVAISTCAMGPLLSMKVQCPRSKTLPMTQTIVPKSMKCGEGFMVVYSQKPSSFSVASQVLMCVVELGWDL